MFEATAAPKAGEARPYWEAPWFLALIVLATTIPLLYPPIPPLVDLFVLVLGPIMGLEPAIKLIVILIPPLTAIGFLWVAREVHGRIPPTALFALPFIYGFPFLFGFVNFALSVALAFLAFGLWLRLGRLGRTGLRGILFAPIALILFFCHTYGWGLLGL